MMKKFNILITLTLLLALVACEKDRAFTEFKDLEYGALPRKINGVNGEFNFFNPTGSGVDFTVEFYDENQGKNVQSYAWSVAYVNKTTNVVGQPALLATFTAADFKPEPTSGLPSIKIEFSFAQVLSALGLTTADINGGDAIRFNATLTKTDGKVFTFNNTGPSVISNGPAFGALFTFDQNIICPSDIGGTFDYVHTMMLIGPDANPCGPTEHTGTVTWEALGSGVYKPSDLSFGQYDVCWNDAPAVASATRIIDACGKMSIQGGDQYGLVYTYNITEIAGKSMTIVWENSYNDHGIVVLTRQDGKDWPPLSF
ncbi:MAG: hypothetical protein R2828_21825 [Saprospiraceae bacterium]